MQIYNSIEDATLTYEKQSCCLTPEEQNIVQNNVAYHVSNSRRNKRPNE